MIIQRTPEWRAARAGRITGSRIATVLGRNPYQSRRQLISEMVREHHGIFDERDAPPLSWGRDHEGVALDDFAAKHAGFDDELIIGGWLTVGDTLGFSPDARCPGKYLVELKAPFSQTIPNIPPEHYSDQCQLGMAVANLPRAALHFWTPKESRTFWLEADEEWRRQALVEVGAFMVELRKALQEPEQWIVAERDDGLWLGEAWAYKQANKAFKAAKKDLDDAKERLLKLCNNAPARGGGVVVNWKERSGSVNWAALAKAHNISQEEQDATRGESTRYAEVTISKPEQG